MTRPERDRLQRLLDEVIEFSQPYGKKAELARFLNVPRQHVNAWLSGSYEPSGRVTLELIEWVRLERELQKKSRQARQRPSGKQTRKGTRENSKTDPPRKR